MTENLHPVLLFFFSLNETMQSLLLGSLIVVGILLIALIPARAAKKFPVMHLALALGLVLAFLLPQKITRNLETRYGHHFVVTSTLQQSPALGDLFAAHPDAAENFRQYAQDAIAQGLTREALSAQIAAEVSHIISKYTETYMPFATDEAVYNNLKFSAETLTKLKENPALCLIYTDNMMREKELDMLKEALGDDILTRAQSFKYAIIESGLANTAKTKEKPMALETLLDKLKAGYAAAGFNMAELAALDGSGNFSAAESCNAQANFLTVLSAMSPEDGAHIFRSIVEMSSLSQPPEIPAAAPPEEMPEKAAVEAAPVQDETAPAPEAPAE
ncbi:MAG: hypothetical protein HND56_09330 [Pseudomonadota bacterium]|nr:hypothetical protein [Pseudomonadota bacterium]QKK05877.1 MAG: hypothetical protein HND56_09330 [Pseudomonadota bacterium]